jgi:hypothetical protein
MDGNRHVVICPDAQLGCPFAPHTNPSKAYAKHKKPHRLRLGSIQMGFKGDPTHELGPPNNVKHHQTGIQ